MDEVEILQSLESRKVGRIQVSGHDPSNDMDNCFGFDVGTLHFCFHVNNVFFFLFYPFFAG